MILSTLYFPFLVPVASITMLPLSSSSRCPVLIPEICDYLTHKQEGLCSYDKTNTKNSSWDTELIMDYLGGQFNPQGPYKEEDFRMSYVSEKMWPDRNVTTAVHVRVLWLLKYKKPLEIQKLGTRFSSEVPERTQPCQYFAVCPVKLIVKFWPPEWKENRGMLF